MANSFLLGFLRGGKKPTIPALIKRADCLWSFHLTGQGKGRRGRKRKEKKNKNVGFFLTGFIIIFAVFAVVAFFASYYLFFIKTQTPVKNSESENRNYHIVVTGNSENELFLRQVYEGASSLSELYNSVVEFYVPSSQAEEVSNQSLFDYVSYVNADCVIAYIDSSYSSISVPRRVDETPIPLVATGQYLPGLQQISFIGNSYWELGKKIGDETVLFLKNGGRAIIVSGITPNQNYSSLMNSLQDVLKSHDNISYSVMESPTPEFLMEHEEESEVLLVCLTEEDTIKTAQLLMGMNLSSDKNIDLIGFGTNETCQLYLQKGLISELISLDPKKIGENAIREFYEFRTKGYANSYIAADVKISRSGK